MACFVVPAAEAIIVTAAYFAAKKRETKIEAKSFANGEKFESENKITWSKRLSWLLVLLWGGVAMLIVDHLFSGELVLYPPFLTAMNSAKDTAAMLYEIKTVGVAMSAFVTGIWGAICVGVQLKSRKKTKALSQNNI